jgi:FKBP-type peptidyl-prolyl cis-trans isomerase SlyD
MIIENGRTVTIEYTVWDEDKIELDSNVGEDPLVYKHGEGELIYGLEKELEGKIAGDEFSVQIAPEDAYGMPSDENLVSVALQDIPEDARKEGAVLETTDDDGEVMAATIAHLDEEEAVLDFNHPLAGLALSFQVKVIGVEA